MRFSEVALGCLIAVACVGCPGTIEDPSSFEEIGQASKLDAGNPDGEDAEPIDAGSLDAETQEEDTSVSVEAGPAEDAAPAAPDAARDAASEDAAQPAAEAGIGCDFQGLIMAKCGKSGCHDALAVSNGLDLTSPDLAVRIGGRRGSGECSPYLLINQAVPNQSALYLKVTPDRCGSRMPLGGTLTDGEQACVLRWIESLN